MNSIYLDQSRARRNNRAALRRAQIDPQRADDIMLMISLWLVVFVFAGLIVAQIAEVQQRQRDSELVAAYQRGEVPFSKLPPRLVDID